jgi:hypothetical protein
MKQAISPPFDFHHVTHTQPRHFERLERGSDNELITEFIAIRAAQRPKSTLQGIQADDLGHAKTAVPEVESDSPTIEILSSPITLQSNSVSAETTSTSRERSRSIRSSASIENFSRPAPWSPKSPTSPPPRTSSRNAVYRSGLPVGAMSSCSPVITEEVDEDLLSDTGSPIDIISDANHPQLAVTHAITTADGSARPLKVSPLPTPSNLVVSGSAPSASAQLEHIAAVDLGPSQGLPLRHAYSFPTTKILSRLDEDSLPKKNQNTMDHRPESLQPKATGHWEDAVDYSYRQSAEADCNFDWSHKTIYVEDDSESADLPLPEADPPAESTSSRAEPAQSPKKAGSKACPGAFRPRHASTRNDGHSRPTSRKSATELEDSLFPYGRHQSTSEFRGYQHMPQTSSKPVSTFRVSSNSACIDNDACILMEVSDLVEVRMPIEQFIPLEQCSSVESNSFREFRPLMSKHSSDGSLLSSTTSTIRTYRSSNSVGSLPGLVYSVNSSRESVVAEKMSSMESMDTELHPPSSCLTSASQSILAIERSISEPEHAPRLAVGSSSTDAAPNKSSTAPPSPVKFQGPTQKGDAQHQVVDANQSKPRTISTRTRSASTLSTGQSLPARGSYSLFPTQKPLSRRA